MKINLPVTNNELPAQRRRVHRHPDRRAKGIVTEAGGGSDRTQRICPRRADRQESQPGPATPTCRLEAFCRSLADHSRPACRGRGLVKNRRQNGDFYWSKPMLRRSWQTGVVDGLHLLANHALRGRKWRRQHRLYADPRAGNKRYFIRRGRACRNSLSAALSRHTACGTCQACSARASSASPPSSPCILLLRHPCPGCRRDARSR